MIPAAIVRTSLIAGVRMEDGVTREDMIKRINTIFGSSVSSGSMQMASDKALLSYLLTFLPSSIKESPSTLSSSIKNEQEMEGQEKDDTKYRKKGRITRKDLYHLSTAIVPPVRIFAAMVKSIDEVKYIRIETYKASDAPSNDAYNSVYENGAADER